MDKIEELLFLVSQAQDCSLDDLEKAAYVLQETVERQSLREYLRIKKAKRDYMQMDAIEGTYRQKKESDFEKMRLKALKNFEEIEGFSVKAEYLLKAAAEIEEGVKFLNYNAALKECCNIAFQIEMTNNMVIAGATLSEMIKYIPESQPGDVFHFVERYLGITMDITDEERAMIEASEKEQKSWRGSAGEGVPYFDLNADCWRLDGDKMEYGAVGVAKEFAHVGLKYPFFRNSIQPIYADSFDDVLHALMKAPEAFCIEGVEEYYGVQELNMLRTVREKMLEIHSKNSK